MTTMIRTTMLVLAAMAAVATIAGPVSAIAQEITRAGPDGPVVLVGPDGRVLHALPEVGTVDVYRNLKGQRVLVDRSGHLVATEVPLREVQRARRQNPDITRLPRATTRGSVKRLDLSPRKPPDNTYSGLGQNPDQLSPPLAQEPPQQQGTPPRKGINPSSSKRPEPGLAQLQVALDRTGASPGVIDGRMGGNVQKALDAYATMTGERLTPSNADAIQRKLRETGGPAMQSYTITAADAAGPYVASIPSDYGRKAKLKRLGYTSTAEMLAERFHMDESYMKTLNPNVDFSVPGTKITVANPGEAKESAVTLVIADKAAAQVRAYAENGDLVAAYPATIGSADTPSPSGTVTVERIADNPTYTYNPDVNFKQGDNDKVLTVPPGPNGPVGNMWIALSKPTYGIHGTPAPSLIGKSNSHGCVRLTNWDAHELAGMIKPGTTVKFVN